MPKVSAEHTEARRRQILEGAQRAFARYGYDGATVAKIEEETGQQVLIGPPLGIQRYDVRKNGGTVPKMVHYWSAELIGPEREFVPNDEVDKLEWLPSDKARRKLSYPRDVEILDALDRVTPVVSTLVLVRHAEAVKRKDWDGKDTNRPLTEVGFSMELLVEKSLRPASLEKIRGRRIED